jgi:hypothetical protein
MASRMTTIDCVKIYNNCKRGLLNTQDTSRSVFLVSRYIRGIFRVFLLDDSIIFYVIRNKNSEDKLYFFLFLFNKILNFTFVDSFKVEEWCIFLYFKYEDKLICKRGLIFAKYTSTPHDQYFLHLDVYVLFLKAFY